MGPLALIGAAAVAVVVAAVLGAAFSAPGPRRTRAEWVGASGLFAALLTLFVHLALRAQGSGSPFATLAFGCLVAFFAAGLGVCLVKTVAAWRGRSGAGPSATG
jgi:hypothetical protein